MVEPTASTLRPPVPPRRPVRRPGIGIGIKIEGEITGEEDLFLEGRITGSVDLRSHALTIGPGGHVDATIVGRSVVIAGTLRGDVTAEERIVLLRSADVEGNLVAPRVSLEDGAQFRGGVDLGDGSLPTRPDGRPEPSPEESAPRVDEQTRFL